MLIAEENMETTQMNDRAERQTTETNSFWQKLLSFFGL
jgi:hypothetical protein